MIFRKVKKMLTTFPVGCVLLLSAISHSSCVQAEFYGYISETITPLTSNYGPIATFVGNISGTGTSSFNEIAILSYNPNTEQGQVDLYLIGDVNKTLVLPAGMIPTGMALGYYNSDAGLSIAVSGELESEGAVSLFLASTGDTWLAPTTWTDSGYSSFNGVATYPVSSTEDSFAVTARTDSATAVDDVLFYLETGTVWGVDQTVRVGNGASPIISGVFITLAFSDRELIVGNKDDNTIMVLTPDGGGIYSVASTIGVSGQPQNFATGDFNGNGHLDLAVYSAHIVGNEVVGSTLDIFLGNGLGVFTHLPSTFSSNSTAIGYMGITAGPFCVHDTQNLYTCDDLAIIDGDSISLLSSNCDGTFSVIPNVYVTGNNPSSLSSILVDETDLVQGLVVANQGNCSFGVLAPNTIAPSMTGKQTNVTSGVLVYYAYKVKFTPEDGYGYNLYRDGVLIKTFPYSASWPAFGTLVTQLGYLDTTLKVGHTYVYTLEGFNIEYQKTVKTSLSVTIN